MSASLVLLGVVPATIAALYASVGRMVLLRPVSRDARAASRDFALWWLALAACSLVQAIQQIAAGLADEPERLAAFGTATQVLYVLGVSVALTGLLSYLWFLYRGARAERAIAAFYGLVFLAAAWTIVQRGITGFDTSAYGATPHYARDYAAQPLVDLAFFALFLLPQLGAAIAYLSLRAATNDVTARRRILVVGSALLVWMGASLLSAVAGIQNEPRAILALQGIDVAAAAAIVGAFRGDHGARHAAPSPS